MGDAEYENRKVEFDFYGVPMPGTSLETSGAPPGEHVLLHRYGSELAQVFSLASLSGTPCASREISAANDVGEIATAKIGHIEVCRFDPKVPELFRPIETSVHNCHPGEFWLSISRSVVAVWDTRHVEVFQRPLLESSVRLHERGVSHLHLVEQSGAFRIIGVWNGQPAKGYQLCVLNPSEPEGKQLCVINPGKGYDAIAVPIGPENYDVIAGVRCRNRYNCDVLDIHTAESVFRVRSKKIRRQYHDNDGLDVRGRFLLLFDMGRDGFHPGFSVYDVRAPRRVGFCYTGDNFVCSPGVLRFANDHQAVYSSYSSFSVWDLRDTSGALFERNGPDLPVNATEACVL